MPRSREFEIIERYFTRPPADAAVRVGIGDDAAVVAVDDQVAIAVDTLVCGTHFPASLSARAVGHRSLAVNLSDLAAVGAKPRWATLALTLPDADAAMIEEFAAGFFELAERYSVTLIGGDTTRGPLSVTVQVIGDLTHAPMLRSGARVGDRILVSGTLGAAAAALDCLEVDEKDRSAEANELIHRFSYPEPRVDLGLALRGLVHAAIDISDGLVADLGHICEQSDCGASIDLDALPISTALATLHTVDDAREFALHGGDDYELCLAVAPEDLARVNETAVRVGVPLTDIGEFTAAPGIIGLRDGGSTKLEAKGFAHFEDR